jgi:NAD(P)-dependent dehydrogenase (short-subunit alcohol dehydrogenase family)
MLNDNILIIGANGSIGSAIVGKLFKFYHVIATYHNSCDSLKKYKDKISVVNFNVSNLELISDFIDTLVVKFGPIKSIIYVAGIQSIKPIRFISIEDCKKQFDVNYFSPLFFAKAFARKNIHSNDSSLIFISSLASKKPEPGILNYSASKAALDNLCIGLYPLGIGSANDIANMVRYLISDDASYITGTIVNVDGGASTL